MADYVKNIKKNTLALMNDHKPKVTQKDLAEIISTTQPSVSKALSMNTDDCFALDQLIKIADYFEVSLDELTGRKVSSEKPKFYTLKDVFSILFDLENAVGFNIATQDIEQHWINIEGYPMAGTVSTECIYFDIKEIDDFLVEWRNVKQLTDKDGDVYKKMYNTWKIGILENASNRFIFHTEDRFMTIPEGIDPELPFN